MNIAEPLMLTIQYDGTVTTIEKNMPKSLGMTTTLIGEYGSTVRDAVMDMDVPDGFWPAVAEGAWNHELRLHALCCEVYRSEFGTEAVTALREAAAERPSDLTSLTALLLQSADGIEMDMFPPSLVLESMKRGAELSREIIAEARESLDDADEASA